MRLKVSTADQIPPYQASKWQETLVLLATEEMQALLDHLGDIYIYPLSGLHPVHGPFLQKKSYIETYHQYVGSLKAGTIPPRLPALIVAITTDPDHLRGLKVKEGQQMHRVIKPVVQTKEGSLHYSPQEKKFRSMVYGEGAIAWGVQFSYPQLFQDPETKKVENALTGKEFPDAVLFRTIQRWLRKNSSVFSVAIEGEKVNTPARIGKACEGWIHNHPQLKEFLHD